MEERQKGIKPQENVEMFLLKPVYTPIFGLTVTKDTDIDDIACNGEIHQTIKDLVLTTTIKKNTTTDEYEFEENSEVKMKLKEGTRLVWDEDQGYILPAHDLVTRPEIIDELECLDGIAGLE